MRISFEFIVELLFLASADDIVGNIYYTDLPSEVSVLDLYEFLEFVNKQFENPRGVLILQDHKLGMASKEEVEAIGERIFDELWPEVKEKIIVSEDNLDAHPLLFKMDVKKVIKQVPGRKPLARDVPRIIYPRFYDFLLLFQLFPLLENGDQPTGHELLSEENRRRSELFERNLYEYLESQGFECYHSAEIRGSDCEEIDVLVLNEANNEIWFIEAKFILPETDMSTSTGIENLNGEFDFKVFKVVSNLTPSYVEKREVRFLTDMEFLEFLEDNRTPYDVRY